MNWYYVEAGQQAGPVSETDLLNLVNGGKIQPDTLVWHEGMANWLPYREVNPAAPAAAPPLNAPSATSASGAGPDPVVSGGVEVVCAECGKIFSKDQAIQYGDAWVCANCKPAFVQKLKEGASLSGGVVAMDYAGFWIRFAAKFVDGLIIGVVVGVPVAIFAFLVAAQGARGGGPPRFTGLNLGMNLLLQLGTVAIQILYNGFFLGKYGATPGKMACGLKVVSPDGATISYGRAFGRSAAEILSRITCTIGYIIAAFDGEKRALHDHIASTRVVRK